MAVDATYMNNLLPSQLLINRPNIQQQQMNSAMYNNNNAIPQMNSALVATTNNQQSLMQQFSYQSNNNNNVCDPNNKTDSSGLTLYHNNNNNIVPQQQRKRSRDSSFISELLFTQYKKQQQQQPPFINQDVLFQFQNQTQSEIDRVLANHTEKVRMEMEEQKIRHSRLILSVLQETMAKKLKEKDEEIQRMEKLNMALQERVKSLCVENQVWKELAHTNETTANYLRTNLEQILSHVSTTAGGGDDHRHGGADDDAESCCGSNDDIINKNENNNKCGGPVEEETAATAAVGGGGRMCKSCGVRESIVLLLPCRHLCLCTMCGSSVRNCPVCDSGMDASVHVNLS
ncbi:hypothetical protein PIB30_046320 [Stylosanthes scabra]|uniref:RING-type domain-containing protein n=1 Tax=Stylosanthes scabra TaxID=79078 RepID=A0ABU6TG43_9FABA|nr:hypothetical protein [Stylosanthes scabra]